MKRMLAIYAKHIRISFATAAAYRANFIFALLVSLTANMLAPLLTVLIYAGGAQFPGWSMQEVLVIQAVFLLCTGLCSLLFGNMVWITMEHIREGTYDLMLLKPSSAVFLTAAASFDIENIGAFIGGAGLFIFALLRLEQPPSLQMLPAFLLMLFMGVAMNLGCILLMAATMFKWVGNSRIYEIFDAVTLFGRYPVALFSGGVRVIATYIIPVAMMGYLPAAVAIGRAESWMYAACLPCAGFLALGYFTFSRMTHAYQSAGG